MKANRLLGALLAAGLGLVAITAAPTDAAAQQGKGKGKKEAPAPPAAEPPMAPKGIALSPQGIEWKMSNNRVAQIVDMAIDEAYKPLYKAVSPGVKMKALDAANAEDKSTFRRSRIDFGKLPTTIDGTPLRGEFTYNNKEALMSFARDGKTIYLFFIQDKLWKTIEEIKYGEGTPYGKDFSSAMVKLTKDYGIAGRVLDAAPDKGRPAPEVDWKDAKTHARAVPRGDNGFALILVDTETQANLASLRPNKPAEEAGIDPAVAAALNKNNSANQGPPPEEAKGKPKGKK